MRNNNRFAFSLKKLFLLLNNFFSTSHPKSWVGHFLFYFLFTLLSKLIGLTWQISAGAAIGQEGTQFLIYFFDIPWWDYVGDLTTDAIAILLASTIWSILF